VSVRRSSARLHAGLVAAFIAMAIAIAGGCGGCPTSEDSAAEGDDGNGGPNESAGQTPNNTAACGTPSFPCTWEDVSEEVFDRTDAIAGEALTVAVNTRSADAVAAAIRAHDEAIVLGSSPGAVRFRIDGGRPAWVFIGSDDGMTKGAGLVDLVSPWAGPPAANSDADEPPIGPQRHGEKPKKKALILSPFLWQWELGGTTDADRTREIESIFQSVDDYEDGVTVHASGASNNRIEYNVNLGHFLTFAEYDAIHISTHGGVACDGTDCITGLATGDFWRRPRDPEEDKRWRQRLRMAGIEIAYMPLVNVEAARELGLHAIERETETGAADHSAGTAHKLGPVVVVTSKFFAQNYPGGLDDKIMFFDACEGGKHTDLATVLAGQNTAVIGWTTVVYASKSSLVSSCFWKLLLGKKQQSPRTGKDNCPKVAREARKGGTDVEDAYAKIRQLAHNVRMGPGPPRSLLVEQEPGQQQAGQVRPAAAPVIETVGNDATRGREIIRLVDEDGDQLSDRGAVKLVGAPGDGEADQLEVTAELMGLRDDDDPNAFRIQLSVDDREVASTWTAVEPVEPGVFRGTKLLDLGFDLPEGRRFNLDPWVTYPGGLSRWHYEDIAAEYFVFTVSGPAFSTPQTFIVAAEDINPHWITAGGLKLGYWGSGGATVVSEDGSLLKNFLGSQRLPQDVTAGEHPFGEGPEGRFAFTIIIIPQNKPCPAGAKRCPRRTLATELGSIDITEYRLGKGVSRPHATGPNVVAGTFEMPARAAKPWQGEQYRIKGALFLID